MNFLAHFHIASLTNTSLTGALLGDFVRGSQFQQFPADVQLGISLHRKVDSYSEQMPYLKLIRPQFAQGQRRYLGIVTDMLVDHKLSQQWHQFYHMPLPDYAESVYSQLAPLPQTATRYDGVRLAMSQGNWLCRYHTEQQILHALSRISQRLKRPVDLAAIGARCLQDFQPELEQAIVIDYPTLVIQLEQWLLTSTATIKKG